MERLGHDPGAECDRAGEAQARRRRNRSERRTEGCRAAPRSCGADVATLFPGNLCTAGQPAPRVDRAYILGTGRHSMISTECPGRIVKCGWLANRRAAASCDSASMTTYPV